MVICRLRRATAALRSGKESDLQQIRLIHIFNGNGSSPTVAASVSMPTGPPPYVVIIVWSICRSICRVQADLHQAQREPDPPPRE